MHEVTKLLNILNNRTRRHLIVLRLSRPVCITLRDYETGASFSFQSPANRLSPLGIAFRLLWSCHACIVLDVVISNLLAHSFQRHRYFGEMDRAEATQLLTGCENGTFLVRISKNVSRMGEYSLSVVYHHPRHIRIQRSSDSCFYLCSPQRFKSLEVSLLSMLFPSYSPPSFCHSLTSLLQLGKLWYPEPSL